MSRAVPLPTVSVFARIHAYGPTRLVAVAVVALHAGAATAAPPVKAPPKPSPEFLEVALERRKEIPLGGDFTPNPTAPAFVAVGHGGRILLSRDDGRTWKQVFFGHPGADHGPWATKSVAYTDGVFAVAVGWTTPCTWLASEDGKRWRHLTDGKTVLKGVKGADGDPSVMPETWGLAGGKGAFVSTGYMTMAATPDFGRTITLFRLTAFKNDPRSRKLNTHHIDPVYCGDSSGRFLALGDDRSPEHPVFGNLFASDDLGKTWKWLEPKLLDEQCVGRGALVSNGEVVLLTDKQGANAFVSTDAGDTWEGPFPTGVDRAEVSVVGKDFWMIGPKAARSSADGKTWSDLPEGIPAGVIAASSEGTLVSIAKNRGTILRSEDGGRTWTEAHAFEMETEQVHGGQGLRDVAFGLIAPAPAGE